MYQPRIYVIGPPNNDKTGAIVRTAAKPLYVINCPGETGYATLPVGDPEIVVAPLLDPAEESSKLLEDFSKICDDAIKSGKYQTIAIEGIGNLMDYQMDSLTDGAYFAGEKPDWNIFGFCYHKMDLWIAKMMINNVHQVIFTSWAKEKGERKARKGEKPEDVPQLIGPALLGEYTRTIIGRIPMVFHQTLQVLPGQLDKEGKKIYGSRWQTRPHGLVRGVGIKGPAKIVQGIPLYIPADYTYLKQMWEELDK